MPSSEVDLYEQLAQYMNIKHPLILYHFDLSGVYNASHFSRNLYGRLNRRAWPDLFIATASRSGTTVKLGLFLELKKEGTVLYKTDGKTLRANAHHEEQAGILKVLRIFGYCAEFAVGFDQAVALIEKYLA